MSNQDIDRPNECFVSGFPSFSNEKVAHTFAAKLNTLLSSDDDDDDDDDDAEFYWKAVKMPYTLNVVEPDVDEYRIVQTDNFGGDYPNECFVTGVGIFTSNRQAQKVAEQISKLYSGDNATRYWKVVKMPYTLQPGFEP